jgi:RNA polymerase sigma-70 factor, ECF subfamily
VTRHAAFETHYRESFRKVCGLAISLSGNRHDAEEITQEAFCRALRAFDSFRGESAFSTWIYRITVNVANGYLKRRSKMPMEALTEDLGYRMEDILDPDPSNDPEAQLLERSVRIKCLFSLTECLSGESRRVFCLAVTLGLPHRQVAEILECSTGKVKTALFRARQRWFGYMEDHCSLLRASNPCRCGQWVRFALEKGLINREEAAAAGPVPDVPALLEVKKLKAMTLMYRSLHSAEADAALCSRIRKGIGEQEWKLLS